MLSPEDIKQYQDQGYIIKHGFFSEEKMQEIDQKAIDLEKNPKETYVYEKDNVTLRRICAPHQLEPYFDDLAKDQAIITSVNQLLGGDSYIHQYKLNFKNSFTGDVWEWHSDYYFWKVEDGMQRDDALTAVIYIDDATEFNGPILLVPGSHKEQVDPYVETQYTEEESQDWRTMTAAKLKYSLNKEYLKRRIEEKGLVSAAGKRGTALFFHSSLLHSSSSNITPWRRRGVFLSYNLKSNPLVRPKNPRPNFLATPYLNEAQAS